MKAKIVIYAIVGGALITLLTGLISSTPPMLLGAVWYGYPLSWLLRLVIAPEYFPWVVDFLSLAVDVIFWALIIGVVLLISSRKKKWLK